MRKSIIFALAVLSLTACTNRPITYSGETSTLQNGQVLLQQSCGHVALIERKN